VGLRKTEFGTIYKSFNMKTLNSIAGASSPVLRGGITPTPRIRPGTQINKIPATNPPFIQKGASTPGPASQEIDRLATAPRTKPTSLTALASQVQTSYRWENALWLTLGFASLALLALSFLL
jgi:hypothetical protein